MKKSLIAILAFSAFTANAQTTTPRNNNLNPGGVYIKAGVNFANISTTESGRVDEANSLTGFQAGLVADIPLATAFSFQTGLSVQQKGAKTEIYFNDNNTAANYYKVKTKPLYLELPANFVFKIPLGGDSRLFVGAGPYVAMGIGGKTEGESNLAGVTSRYERDIEFNNDDPFTEGQEDASVNRLRRFDYGVNGLAGFEAGNFLLSVGYGHGLAKIGSTERNEDDRNKHRVLSLSVGFRF